MYYGINRWVYFQEKSTRCTNFVQKGVWAYFRGWGNFQEISQRNHLLMFQLHAQVSISLQNILSVIEMSGVRLQRLFLWHERH